MDIRSGWMAFIRGSSWYIVTILVLCAVAFGIYQAYQSGAEWTGLYEFAPTATPDPAQVTPVAPGAASQIVNYKTLWDWLELLIVPFVLAVFGIFFSQAQKATDLSIQHAKEQEIGYHSFLDKMTELILTGRLVNSPPDSPARDLAKSRVLTALQGLDNRRKLIVLNFLMDANLIRPENAFIQMDGADFTGVDFNSASLIRININGANFNGARLSRAVLSDSDFSWSTFDRAKLHGAVLKNAVLVGCSLVRASLKSADMDGANFNKANLKKADFSFCSLDNARMTETHLEGANFSESVLNGVHFGGSRLSGTQFRGASLRRAVFAFDPAVQQANIEFSQRGLENLPVETVIDRADFLDADLFEADFSGVNLSLTRGLERSNLQRANLTRAILTGIDLRQADLSEAVLDCAVISKGFITDKQLANVKSREGLVFI